MQRPLIFPCLFVALLDILLITKILLSNAKESPKTQKSSEGSTFTCRPRLPQTNNRQSDFRYLG